MAGLPVHNLEGKRVGAADLPKGLEGPVDPGLLWRAVRAHLANRRQGNASTKTRGEVSGGGKKPWRQKHTGRARAGSSRSPLWVKGGVTFGPKPRDHRVKLSRRLRRKALLHALRDRIAEGHLTVLESFDGIEPKTRSLAAGVRRLSDGKTTLLVAETVSPALKAASRNLAGVRVRSAGEVNCYDILSHACLVATPGAVKHWERLSE